MIRNKIKSIKLLIIINEIERTGFIITNYIKTYAINRGNL